MARQKRTNLLLPSDLKERVEAMAQVKKLPAAEVYRDLLRLGLLIDEVQRRGGKLLCEENGKRREIVVV